MGLNTIKGTGNWGGAASDLNNNFASITAEVEKLKAANVKFKGYYTTELTLKAAHPSPTVGDTAWVGETYPGVVYRCNVVGAWLATTDVPPSNTVNLSEYLLRSELYELTDELGDSETAVMSQKAVTDELAQLAGNLAYYGLDDLEQGYYYPLEGEKVGFLTSSTARLSMTLSVIEGEKYTIYGKGLGASSRTYAVADKDGYILDRAGQYEETDENPLDITIPAGGVKMYINHDKSQELFSVIVNNPFIRVNENIEEKLTGRALKDGTYVGSYVDLPVLLEMGIIPEESATIVPSTSNNITEFIPVKEGDVFLYTGIVIAGIIPVGGWVNADINEPCIELFDALKGDRIYDTPVFKFDGYQFTIPNGINYIVCCSRTAAHPQTPINLEIGKITEKKVAMSGDILPNEILGIIIHEEDIFDGKYYNPLALADYWDIIDTERFPETVSIIFPIKKGCVYTVVKKEPSDRFRIALFDQNPENQNGLKAVRVIIPYESDQSGASRSFKVSNENEKYAVVQISASYQEPNLNVIETKLAGKGNEAYEIATENKELLDSWQTTEDIFDGVYYNDFIISSGNGKIYWGTGEYEGGVGVIARLTPYAKYHINRVEITDRFRIGICSSYPKTGMTPDRTIDAFDSDKTVDFIAEENENWLVIQLAYDSVNKTPEIQIIEDSAIFNRKTTINIGDVNVDNLFENNPRNLFKGLQDEIALQTDNSVIIEKEGFLSSIVKIEADQRYIINLNIKYQSSYKIGFFSSYPEIGDAPLRVLTTASNEDTYIKTGGNEKYLLISDFPVDEETILYVDYYESSGLVIADKYLDKAPKILGQFNSFYNSLEIEPIPGRPYDFNNIYDAYDSLVNDFGDCISKNLLGYASDANGDEDTNMPIYEYVIKPPTNNLGGDYELLSPPTLLISSGVHGDENEAIWCTYLFVKQMLNNYDTDDFLNSVKSNLILRIIPLVNPGGYNANTRANYNSVNINRNFETGWHTSLESGASPLSEPETKVIVKWFKEHHQAIAYIDHHNFSSIKGPNQVSYFISSNDKLRVMYSYMMRRLSNSWRKKYLNIPESNEALGYVNTDYSKNSPLAVSDAYEIYGFKLSAIIERKMGDTIFDTDNGLKLGVEILANYIGSLISTYFQ